MGDSEGLQIAPVREPKLCIHLYWFPRSHQEKTLPGSSCTTPHKQHEQPEHQVRLRVGVVAASAAVTPAQEPQDQRPRCESPRPRATPTGAAPGRGGGEAEEESAAGHVPPPPPRMRRPVALRPARRAGPRTLTGGGMAADQFVGGDPRGRRRHVLRGVASPRRSPAPPPRGRGAARRPWGLLFPADATTRGTAMRETSPRERRRAGRRERRGRTGRLRHGGRRLRGRNRAHAGGRGRSRGGRGPEWMGCPGAAAAEEAVG